MHNSLLTFSQKLISRPSLGKQAVTLSKEFSGKGIFVAEPTWRFILSANPILATLS
jgi:hypothetical protein